MESYNIISSQIFENKIHEKLLNQNNFANFLIFVLDNYNQLIGKYAKVEIKAINSNFFKLYNENMKLNNLIKQIFFNYNKILENSFKELTTKNNDVDQNNEIVKNLIDEYGRRVIKDTNFVMIRPSKIFDDYEKYQNLSKIYSEKEREQNEKYQKIKDELKKYKDAFEDFNIDNPLLKKFNETYTKKIDDEVVNIIESTKNEYSDKISNLKKIIDDLSKKIKDDFELFEQKETKYKEVNDRLLKEVIETRKITFPSGYYDEGEIKKLKDEITKYEKIVIEKNRFIEKTLEDINKLKKHSKETSEILSNFILETEKKTTYLNCYLYLKFKKYNNNYYNKTIINHLHCKECKKKPIENEKFLSFPITPLLLNTLNNYGIEKIILFDEKNCCSDIEKIIVKASSILCKKYGGKSSIWYRNYLVDKYVPSYDKKNIDHKFYYTYLSKYVNIADKYLDMESFLKNENKKFEYYNFYKLFDKENHSKISLNFLSKKEIEYLINNKKNKKINEIKKFFKMFSKKDIPRECNELISIDSINDYKKILSESKHFKIPKSKISKRIEKHGYVSEYSIEKFIKKYLDKKTTNLTIEKMKGDVIAYKKKIDDLNEQILKAMPYFGTISNYAIKNICKPFIKDKKIKKYESSDDEYLSDFYYDTDDD